MDPWIQIRRPRATSFQPLSQFAAPVTQNQQGAEQLRIFYMQMRLPKIKRYLDLVTSVASQQMLLYFVNGSLRIEGPSDQRARFLSALRNIGTFPTTAKRIGVANGCRSGFGNSTPSEEKIVDWDITTPGVRLAQALLYSSPGGKSPHDPSPWVYFSGGAFCQGGTDTIGRSQGPLPKIDSAPGGTDAFFKTIGDSLRSSAIPYHFWRMDVTNNDACFIPTISALAMSLSPYRQDDLYYDVDPITNPHPPASEFTAWFASESNTPHIEITPEIKNWVFQQFGIAPAPDPAIVQILGQTRPTLGNARPMPQELAVSADGKLYNRFYYYAKNAVSGDWGWRWSDWSSTHAGIGYNNPFDKFVRKAFMFFDPSSMDLVVSLVTKSSSTFYFNSFDGQSWRTWSLILQPSGKPQPIRDLSGAWNGNTGQYKMFIAANDGDLYVAKWPPGATPFVRLGNIGAPQDGWNVNLCAVGNINNGNVEIFANSADNKRLLHAYIDGGQGAWNGFRDDRPGLSFSKAPIDTILSVDNYGIRHLELFLLTTDNDLYHNYYDGNWHGWSNDRPHLGLSPNIIPVSIATVPNNSGGVEVFLATTNGEIYHNYYNKDTATGWRGWSSTDTGLQLPPSLWAAKVFANWWTPQQAALENTAVEVFLISKSRALYRNELNRFGWRGWEYWPWPLDLNVSGAVAAQRATLAASLQ